MTSCVAIAQLRAGRKIFNRQHLQELAMRGGGRRASGGGEQKKKTGESLTVAKPD